MAARTYGELMKLDEFITLGRSGLRVSPLCLRTMTFGTAYTWTAGETDARSLFDRYCEAGGNFFDTADGYSNGESEQWLGRFVAARRMRDRAVIATKFTFSGAAGDPNAGGNGRKNIYRALEGSLRRLGTDYIDVYWLHCWDMHTPAEEVASTLDDLVRSGKVRYIGLSNVPAWYAARFQASGFTPAIALQLEYSLVERAIEREHVPMAREYGLGIVPWSPLAQGLLAGKYSKTDRGATMGAGRIEAFAGSTNPVFERFAHPSNRAWSIVDATAQIAHELGRTSAEVALAWVIGRPGVTSTLLGATKLAQLDRNLAALELVLPDTARARLDSISALERVHPYMYFGPEFQALIHGGASVTSR